MKSIRARRFLARHAADAMIVLLVVAGVFFSITYANRTAGKQDATITQLQAQQAQLQSQQQAACAFAADVGSVPLPDAPRPTKLGVSLVVDSRAQWRKLHCPGTLPVPPGLAKWAAYYHLGGH